VSYSEERLNRFIEKLKNDELRMTDYGALLKCLKEVKEELARLDAVRQAHKDALKGSRDLSIGRAGLPEVEDYSFMS
jgi:hypothetical protein